MQQGQAKKWPAFAGTGRGDVVLGARVIRPGRRRWGGVEELFFCREAIGDGARGAVLGVHGSAGGWSVTNTGGPAVGGLCSTCFCSPARLFAASGVALADGRCRAEKRVYTKFKRPVSYESIQKTLQADLFSRNTSKMTTAPPIVNVLNLPLVEAKDVCDGKLDTHGDCPPGRGLEKDPDD